MIKTRLFLSLGLFAVLLASCAPPAVTEPPAQSAAPVLVIAPSATPQANIPSPTPGVAAAEVPAPTPLPIATSRGPNLEAIDPATVSLASGQIQFVEFFRFT